MGETDLWKKQKLKISFQTPFKPRLRSILLKLTPGSSLPTHVWQELLYVQIEFINKEYETSAWLLRRHFVAPSSQQPRRTTATQRNT
jgi:hypothetical protein